MAVSLEAASLCGRFPQVEVDELVASMVPPPRFDTVRFDTYLPDPDHPAQAAAVDACRAFADQVTLGGRRCGPWSWFRGGPVGRPGLYLDGGFGVGKTHLLASLWHAVPGPRLYGTFVELTHLVGALGFQTAITRLSEHRLLAIDEFELDDPGDTMLITRLIGELTAAGVFVAATSNTLPDRLGEGRFAAEDFLREIRAMAEDFTVARVDGPDYRHRDLPTPPDPVSDAELTDLAESTPEATVDDFTALCDHLSRVHPSKYGRMITGAGVVCLRDLRPLSDQGVALRVVALVDRLYDREIPVATSGRPLSELFTPDMLAGGYRKKYLRALSRLTALSRDAVTL